MARRESLGEAMARGRDTETIELPDGLAVVPSFRAMDPETKAAHLARRHPGVPEPRHEEAHTGLVDHEHEVTRQDIAAQADIVPGRGWSRAELLALGYQGSGEVPHELNRAERDLLNNPDRGWNIRWSR